MGAMMNPKLLPVGFRFHPTGEEFITHYLDRRVQGIVDHPCIIPDVDIYQHDPCELPDQFHRKSIIGHDYQVQKWWFFSPHAPQKFKRSTQVKRSTPSGYWKKTGDDKDVKAKGTGRVIGTKEYLVFYTGRGKNANKTNWVIHAYHLPVNMNGTHVLCRLKYKRDKKADDSTIESEHEAIIRACLEMVLHQPDHEYSYDEAVVQALTDSLRELIQPKNPVEFTADQHQPALGTENSSSPINGHQLTNIEASDMDLLLDNGLTDETIQLMFGTSEEDEEVGEMQNADLASADFFDGYMQTEYDQTSNLHNEHPVLMNRRAQITNSVHGFVADEEKKGVVKKKYNGSPVPNIKSECISLDETAGRAKVRQYKERGSDRNSTKKTDSKENEYAREKSNLVVASTGTTSKSTNSSTNSPLSNLVNVLVAIFMLLTIIRLVLNF